jgi:hypothetical protein
MFSSKWPLASIGETLGVPTLEITLKKEWGSNQKNYRREIRNGLGGKLGEDFSDLEKWPTSKKTGISISHCPHLGGFALVTKPGAIGFDVEVEARVQEKIMARMAASPQEMSDSPSPAHLWVAKEAAYKSLGESVQPHVLSEIEIRDWTRATLSGSSSGPSKNDTFAVWKFRAFCLKNSHLQSGQGVVFTQPPLIFALFALSTST